MRKTKKNKARFFEIVDVFVTENAKLSRIYTDEELNIIKLYTDVPEDKNMRFIPTLKSEMREDFFKWKIEKLTDDYNRLLDAVYEITDRF